MRVFGKLYETGWRPRRTLLFASWGSEEYGLIGSQEWVEEHLTILKSRSVAYVNCDIAVKGNWTFSPAGTPNMRQLVEEVTKIVENPRSDIDGSEYKSIWDNMLLRRNLQPDDTPPFPAVGRASDYAPFLQSVGTSVLHMEWTPHPSVGGYPVYHSIYETYELVADFVDPGFHIHQQSAKVFALGNSVLTRFSCHS